MPRIACCCCGALRAEVSGDPALVAVCHCEQCQRRTGSAFGISAYFPAGQVRVEGASKIFSRVGQEGRQIEGHFCPECGTTLYWQAEFMSGHVGIAAGTFFDPNFPAPTVSAWEQSKHPWVIFGHKVLHLQGQRPPLGLPLGLALLLMRSLGRIALSRWLLLTVLQWVSPARPRPGKAFDSTLPGWSCHSQEMADPGSVKLPWQDFVLWSFLVAVMRRNRLSPVNAATRCMLS